MKDDTRWLNGIKYTASAVCLLLMAGILMLMLLASGKTGDEGDIAGVVAPALLLTCASGVVAAAAAVRLRRVQQRAMRP